MHESGPPLIALLTRSLDGGGVQRMTRHVAAELAARGYRVELVTRAGQGAATPVTGAQVVELPAAGRLRTRRLAWQADPAGWRELLRPVLVPIGAPEPLRLLEPLAEYLRQRRPAALISATTYLNVAALLARRLAGTDTPILVSERDNLSQLRQGRNAGAWRWRHAPALLARLYATAEAVVGVSEGVSRDLARLTGLPRERIATVYNPVVTDRLRQRSDAPTGEPWLDAKDRPVVLAAGRLVEKKRLGDLLDAFALLRATHDARLLILGEGRERPRLERRIRALGLEGHVRLPGWVDDPYAYMARADALALTSEREGFGNVIVEALACGCPVVAADCPSGPAEILAHGRYGRLVPVGDVPTLARALAATLDAPPDPEHLRRRAGEFTVERATDRYLELLGLPANPGLPQPQRYSGPYVNPG